MPAIAPAVKFAMNGSAATPNLLSARSHNAHANARFRCAGVVVIFVLKLVVRGSNSIQGRVATTSESCMTILHMIMMMS